MVFRKPQISSTCTHGFPFFFFFFIFSNAAKRCHWFSVFAVLICKHGSTDRWNQRCVNCSAFGKGNSLMEIENLYISSVCHWAQPLCNNLLDLITSFFKHFVTCFAINLIKTQTNCASVSSDNRCQRQCPFQECWPEIVVTIPWRNCFFSSSTLCYPNTYLQKELRHKTKCYFKLRHVFVISTSASPHLSRLPASGCWCYSRRASARYTCEVTWLRACWVTRYPYNP